jgi:hypothetical protein
LADNSSASLGVTEVRRLADRALVFQRYIFKRVWGINYAIWALAFATYFFFPSLVSFLGFSNYLGEYAYVAINLAVSLLAGISSYWVGQKSQNILIVRNAIEPPKKRSNKKLLSLGLWWGFYYAIIILAAIFLTSHFLTIVFGLATSVILYFYYTLRSCFPESIPLEGKLAVSVFAAAVTGSFAYSLFSQNPIMYAILWATTVLVWLSASLYSLLRAPEELVEASTVR